MVGVSTLSGGCRRPTASKRGRPAAVGRPRWFPALGLSCSRRTARRFPGPADRGILQRFIPSETGLFGPILANWAKTYRFLSAIGGAFTQNLCATPYTCLPGVYGTFRLEEDSLGNTRQRINLNKDTANTAARPMGVSSAGGNWPATATYLTGEHSNVKYPGAPYGSPLRSSPRPSWTPTALRPGAANVPQNHLDPKTTGEIVFFDANCILEAKTLNIHSARVANKPPGAGLLSFTPPSSWRRGFESQPPLVE